MDNDYVWPNDPINKHDLTGKLSADSAEVWASRGHVVRAGDIGANVPTRSQIEKAKAAQSQRKQWARVSEMTKWASLGMAVASSALLFAAVRAPRQIAPLLYSAAQVTGVFSWALGSVSVFSDCAVYGADMGCKTGLFIWSMSTVLTLAGLSPVSQLSIDLQLFALGEVASNGRTPI